MVTTNRNTGFAARAGQGDGGRGMQWGQGDGAGAEGLGGVGGAGGGRGGGSIHRKPICTHSVGFFDSRRVRVIVRQVVKHCHVLHVINVVS